MPPITAIARGCSICEPAPIASDSGNHSRDGGHRGHQDGAQPAFAGFDHGVARRVAFGAETLIGVEQQNAVLGHDADHHDQSHERRDIERGAGDQQREEDARGREQRRGQDRGGRSEACRTRTAAR